MDPCMHTSNKQVARTGNGESDFLVGLAYVLYGTASEALNTE